MKKINFENLPSTNTPLNAENLNQMQDNIEEFINEEKPLIYRGKITASIGKGFANSAGITATVPDGYTFLCWLQPASNGWVSALYMQDPYSASTNIWNVTPDPNNSVDNSDVDCTYLCIKNIGL